MRRKRLSPNAGDINRLPRRRPKPDPPEVPVFQPARSANPAPPNPETNDDPTEDAVRRMVEAAYT
jgi:hypothetical protein